MKKEENGQGNFGATWRNKNIRSIAHCMTRLRLTLHDESKVNMNLLKKVEGVMGVIEDETLQVVVGPEQ